MSLEKKRGSSPRAAGDGGQGTLSRKYEVEKGYTELLPLELKDKKASLFIFQKVT